MNISITTLRVVILVVSLFLFLTSYSQQMRVTEELFQKASDTQEPDSIIIYASMIDSIGRSTNNEHALIKGKLLASFDFYSRNKLDTALYLLDECDAYFREHPSQINTVDFGRMHYYKALVRFRNQEHQLSKKSAEQAVEIFRKTGHSKYQGGALRVLGGIEQFRDNYPKALEYMLEAYKVKRNGGHPPITYASELTGIAFIYKMMNQMERSFEYERRALAIYKEVEEKGSLMYSYNNLGTLHQLQNNRDSAIYYYQEGNKIANEIQNPTLQFSTRHNIANLYSKAGSYQQSNSLIFQNLKDYPEVSAVLKANAIAVAARNYLALGKYDSAIVIASKAYEEAKNLRNKQTIIQLTDVLAQAYEKRGLLKPALDFYKIQYSFRDSIYSQENQRKLSTLYAEIETIGKQNEIDLLEKQKSIDQAENRALYATVVLGTITFVMIITVLILRHRNGQKKQILINYQLQNELEQKKRDLHQQALRMIYINNGLTEVQNSLKKIKGEAPESQHDVQQVINTIQINRSLEKEWENFERYFGHVHTGFFERFNLMYPSLTILERRLAGLIRMNLTNSEIASVLNIETKSVKMAKYRLKKRMEVPEDQDVNTYLQSF